MKSLFSGSMALRPLIFFLLVGGLSMLLPSSVYAQSQTTNNDFLSLPAGPYVTSDQAISLLEGQCSELKEILSGLNSSSQAFKIAAAKYGFFSHILDALLEGKTVQESLLNGLQLLNSKDNVDLPKGMTNEFKAEAIDLLT
jgi:hypothetical protein